MKGEKSIRYYDCKMCGRSDYRQHEMYVVSIKPVQQLARSVKTFVCHICVRVLLKAVRLEVA